MELTRGQLGKRREQLLRTNQVESVHNSRWLLLNMWLLSVLGWWRHFHLRLLSGSFLDALCDVVVQMTSLHSVGFRFCFLFCKTAWAILSGYRSLKADTKALLICVTVIPSAAASLLSALWKYLLAQRLHAVLHILQFRGLTDILLDQFFDCFCLSGSFSSFSPAPSCFFLLFFTLIVNICRTAPESLVPRLHISISHLKNFHCILKSSPSAWLKCPSFI